MPRNNPPEKPEPAKRMKLAGAMRRLLSDDKGVSAIEYVVIICFTAAMAVIAWTLTGGNISNTLNNIASYISGSGGGGPEDPDAEDSDESDESDDDEDDSDDGDDEDDSDDDEDGSDEHD